METKKFDIICDVDGTLVDITKRLDLAIANAKHGKRMNWDIFLDSDKMYELDEPNHDVIELVKSFISNGHRVVITSARNERHREVTEKQLREFGINFEKLYLRADDDFRNDADVKEEILGQIRGDGFDPHVAIDDRQRVVDRWRELGLNCYQVRVTTD
jgi:predicted secreted acid phosphatase